MNTILVPLDFSEVMPRQLQVLEAHLPSGPCRILLAHVHHSEVPLDNISTIEVDREYAAVERGQLAEALNNVRYNLRERPEVTVESEFRSGAVTATLLDLIRSEGDICLVVMGTHGHGRLFNLLMGSTAEALLRKSHVPILFVPPAPENLTP